MCGIAGILQPGPSHYQEEHLHAMTQAIAHRGPDETSFWNSPDHTVLFGHRRLAIIDLTPSGAQPMHYLERYTIVYNGEIYNYIELRNELAQKGYKFNSQSDTEVILASYDCWADDCVDHFDGMFAFAIWDEKEKELFAARDRFGEKPFFYFFDGNCFLFGSEMKALWAAGIPKNPNLQMVFNFLTIGYVDNPARPEETFYNNIQKLPAASVLYYSPRKTELIVEKYWDLEVDRRPDKITDADALEKFSSLLQGSIHRRLRSDVPIGTSLSGGLDSSAIVSMLGSSVQDMQAFTAIFPGFEKDEAAFAASVARQVGITHFQVESNSNDLVNNWDQLCYHQEEPFGSASIFAQYAVYNLAREKGTKVLLDGQGADETMAGYSNYYKWYWQELFIKRRLLSSGELKAARQKGVTDTFGVRNIVAALFPDVASVVLERQYLVKALRQEDLTRDFVKQQSREAYYSRPAHFNLHGALYFNACTHGLEELLRYADRNSMAHGREVRLPYLDHSLVEFLFSIPSNFKIRNGWTKWILRKTFDGKLPEDITWRKDKVGFEPPQLKWMQDKRVQEMIMAAREKLVSEKILNEEVLNKPVIAKSSHSAGNYDWRYLSVAAFLK